MNWKGWIIDKSLNDISILSSLKIIKSQIEENTSTEKKRIWKLYTVEIEDDNIKKIAKDLEKKIKPEYYIHFTNGKKLLIVFYGKSFFINVKKAGKDDGKGIGTFIARKADKKLWKEAFEYGITKGKVDPRYIVEVT